jgi:hypothetical protein
MEILTALERRFPQPLTLTNDPWAASVKDLRGVCVHLLGHPFSGRNDPLDVVFAMG